MNTQSTTARNAAIDNTSDELIRAAGAAAALRRIAADMTGSQAAELSALAIGLDNAHHSLRGVYEHLEASTA